MHEKEREDTKVGNQNPEIEGQTTQWPKEKSTKDKQRSTKHTHKDRVTRTPLKTGDELRCSGMVGSSCSTSGTRRVTLVTNAVGHICEMFIFIKCRNPFCYFFLISCLFRLWILYYFTLYQASGMSDEIYVRGHRCYLCFNYFPIKFRNCSNIVVVNYINILALYSSLKSM